MMKKFISIILILVLSMSFFGCDEKQTGNSTVIGGNSSAGNVGIENVTETEDLFVNNGTSQYKIVIDKDNSSSNLSFAVSELNTFVEMATAVKLQIITDDVAVYDEQSTYIVLGKNDISDAQNIDVSTCNESGYKIKSVGKSVFIVGKTEYGVLRGVYRFLNLMFDYVCYAADEIKITKSENAKLLNFDVEFNPSIPLVMGTWFNETRDSTYTKRMNALGSREMMMTLQENTYVHSTFSFVDPTIYYECEETDPNYHPEWFGPSASPEGIELCFTRNAGYDYNEENPESNTECRLDENKIDEANNDEMFQLILGKMKNLIVEGGEKFVMDFSQQDTSAWCICDRCKLAKNTYANSNLAIMIMYANRLAEEIEEWKQTENITKETKIMIIAYQETMDAPVVKNSSGDYVACAPEVVCHKDIMIQFAPLRMVMNESFYHEKNKAYADIIKKLHAVTDNIGMWYYGTYFHNFLVPLNDFEAWQGTLQFFAENGVTYAHHESIATTGSSTFTELRIFLDAKLCENPYLDFDALVSEFFENYFKDAAPAMREYFEGFRQLSTYNRDVLAMPADVGSEVGTEKYFPFPQLQKWQKSIDAAFASIEHLKNSDFELYQKLYDRILKEEISVRYLTLKIYPQNFNDSELYDLRSAFKNDCTRLYIVREGNSNYMSALYTAWGV